MADMQEDCGRSMPMKSVLNNNLTNAAKESIIPVFRKYDTNNDGIFSPEEIALMMVAFNRANNSNILLKKYCIVSFCVITLLIVSNLCTTLIVIHLSKDIKVSSDGVMKQVGGDNILKTKTIGYVFDIDALRVQPHNKDGSDNQNRYGQWKACVSMDLIDKLYQDSLEGSVSVVRTTDDDGNELSITLKGNAKRNMQDGTGSFSDSIFYRPGCNDFIEDSSLSGGYATIGSSPDNIF